MKTIFLFLTIGTLSFLGIKNIDNSTDIKTHRTITGIVLDENQEPVVGAKVVESGTEHAVITNIDGRFSINVVKAAKSIEISYLGYVPQTISLTSKSSYTVNLVATVINSIPPPPPPPVKKSISRVSDYEAIAAPVASPPSTKKYEVRGYTSVAGNMPYDSQPHNTEDYSAIKENAFKRVKDNPLTTFSIDVDRAAYSNVRRFLNNGSLPPVDAVRIEEMINYFHYDYGQPSGKHPFKVSSTVTESPWNEGLQLVHIGLQGKTVDTEDLPASNIVFLLDVSGSMGASNKLPLVKTAFNLLVDQLRPEDKVAIVVYAGAAGLVLPPTSGSDKMKLKEAINNLESGGSTAGGEGIELAYKTATDAFIENGNNRVIIATDGDFNVGSSSDAAMQRLIEEERESGVSLSVLGFGMGNYKDNKMEILADKGNGNYAYIDNLMEAKKVFVTEFGGTLFTIAKDVKLQVEFNPNQVEAYRLIGYENRALNNEDFNDDKKDAGDMGAGHTVTAIYEVVPAGTNSEYLKDIDELKYQKTDLTNAASGKEMMTVKVRYKQPNAAKSVKLEHVVNKKEGKLSRDAKFSIAVAQFGLLLRDSEFKGEATYSKVLEMARAAKGDDKEGYRAEFIKLVQSAQIVDTRTDNGSAKKD